MGEELKKADLSKGGRPNAEKKTGRSDLPVCSLPSLSEIGITKDQSARYQQLAAIPEETFEAVIEAHNLADEPISTASVARAAADVPKSGPIFKPLRLPATS